MLRWAHGFCPGGTCLIVARHEYLFSVCPIVLVVVVVLVLGCSSGGTSELSPVAFSIRPSSILANRLDPQPRTTTTTRTRRIAT